MPKSSLRSEMIAALRWQVEVGADEAVGESPVNRIGEARMVPGGDANRRPAPGQANSGPGRHDLSRGAPSAPLELSTPPPVREGPSKARAAAEACKTVEELQTAIAAFEGCPYKSTALNTVIAQGNQEARVMIVGEAPGAEEDRQGVPFVGRSGQLLDLALSYVGLSRQAANPDHAFYITNIVYWRPPDNRTPTPDEVADLLPFCERHVALVKPEVLLLLGNVACKSLLRTDTGITRLRGKWARCTLRTGNSTVDALPTFHPSFLLRNPRSKRVFWQDLLTLRERLDGGGDNARST